MFAGGLRVNPSLALYIMAFRLKRLASIRTLSSISRMVENLLAPRLESATTSSNCLSRDQRASNHSSTQPGKSIGYLVLLEHFLCSSGVCENATKTVLLLVFSVAIASCHLSYVVLVEHLSSSGVCENATKTVVCVTCCFSSFYLVWWSLIVQHVCKIMEREGKDFGQLWEKVIFLCKNLSF